MTAETTSSASAEALRVKTRGNVDINKIAGDTHQSLSGDEVDATLKEGKVDVLEARHNARMVLGSDQMLDSTQIWTNTTGLVQTKENSVLKVGDSTIEGRDFVIENGEGMVIFNTLRRASLKMLCSC